MRSSETLEIETSETTALEAHSNDTEAENVAQLTVEKMPGNEKAPKCIIRQKNFSSMQRNGSSLTEEFLLFAAIKVAINAYSINELNGTADFDLPNLPHEHRLLDFPKKEEYNKRKLIIDLKNECANIDSIAPNDCKTSVVKSIFNKGVEE